MGAVLGTFSQFMTFYLMIQKDTWNCIHWNAQFTTRTEAGVTVLNLGHVSVHSKFYNFDD